MTYWRRQARRLLVDDQGGEVMEYALVLGLISIVAIAAIATYGTRVLARWNSVSNPMTD